MSISLGFLPGAQFTKVLIDGEPLGFAESVKFFSSGEKSENAIRDSGEYGEDFGFESVSSRGGQCEIVRSGTIFVSPDEDVTREISIVYPSATYILGGCRLIKREKLFSVKDGIREKLIFSFESERKVSDCAARITEI